MPKNVKRQKKGGNTTDQKALILRKAQQDYGQILKELGNLMFKIVDPSRGWVSGCPERQDEGRQRVRRWWYRRILSSPLHDRGPKGRHHHEVHSRSSQANSPNRKNFLRIMRSNSWGRRKSYSRQKTELRLSRCSSDYDRTGQDRRHLPRPGWLWSGLRLRNRGWEDEEDEVSETESDEADDEVPESDLEDRRTDKCHKIDHRRQAAAGRPMGSLSRPTAVSMLTGDIDIDAIWSKYRSNNKTWGFWKRLKNFHL